MRLCIFEDRDCALLEPLTATRPASDLLCGCTSLADKQRRYFAATDEGAVVRPELAALVARLNPDIAVNDPHWLSAGPAVFSNGRWLPPASRLPEHHRLDRAVVGVCGGQVAFAVVPRELAGELASECVDDCLARWSMTLPRVDAGGSMVNAPWDLVALNGEQIAQDFATHRRPRSAGFRPPEVAVVGPPERLRIDPSAHVEPHVVADTRGGPVVIDRDATVSAFSRLEGPCYVGPHGQVLGAKIRAGTTLGPHCRVGGEVECSVLLGHSNKYHEGFLGHSYVGEWVNLAAGTHTSDLRNDYGEVSAVRAGQVVRTGQTKVGSVLGDHVKTGLGVLLNAGTCYGAFAQALPGPGYAAKYLPPFARAARGRVEDESDLPALLRTAALVMRRRGVEITTEHRDLYESLHRHSAAARRQAVREAEQRRLRRGA